jgi:ABC-2 type transport system ATP-binding protein
VTQLRETAVRHLRLVTQGLSEAQLRERLAQVPALRLSGIQKMPDQPGRAMVREVNGTLSGAVRPLIVVAAGLPLLDFTVEEPNLEEAVLALYGPTGSGPTGPGSTGPGSTAPTPQTFHDPEQPEGEHHRHREQTPHQVRHRA